MFSDIQRKELLRGIPKTLSWKYFIGNRKMEDISFGVKVNFKSFVNEFIQVIEMLQSLGFYIPRNCLAVCRARLLLNTNAELIFDLVQTYVNVISNIEKHEVSNCLNICNITSCFYVILFPSFLCHT
jgi:hypothetical protein